MQRPTTSSTTSGAGTHCGDIAAAGTFNAYSDNFSLAEDLQGIRVLIADDGPTERLLLSKMVAECGAEPIVACDGREALELYKQHMPDIVLSDVLMPHMDGLALVKAIRQIDSEMIVPVIFLSAMSEKEMLSSCLKSGGDDYIHKPYDLQTIKAKLRSFMRLRRFSQALVESKEGLVREQSIASSVFHNIEKSQLLISPEIRCLRSPMAIFNGDLWAASRSPSGNIVCLLGDFTGHGLPAAMGVLPTLEMFYSMVKRGISATEVLQSINSKLFNILPIGLFCCAGMLEIDPRERTLHIWNGGLPSIYLLRANGDVVEFESSSLPLGIREHTNFAREIRYEDFAWNDQVVMMSDGISELGLTDSRFPDSDNMLGFFQQHQEQGFQRLSDMVEAYYHESAADDYSLVNCYLTPELFSDEIYFGDNHIGLDVPLDWNSQFRFRAQTIQHYDPLPMMLNSMMEIPQLRFHRSTIYTILSELYSNAVNHGLLQLESAQKDSAEGFADYYALRQKRLRELDSGEILVRINHKMLKDTDHDGGLLEIQVTDTGKGFNYRKLVKELCTTNQNSGKDHTNSELALAGRGIALLYRLSEKVSFNLKGNQCTVQYRWFT